MPLKQSKATPVQCKAIASSGQRCKAKPHRNGLCAFHAEPGRAAELGRKGGARRRVYQADAKEVAAPQSAADVKTILADVMAEIRAGKMNPKLGTTLGYLGTSLLKAIETSDLEERLRKLENANGIRTRIRRLEQAAQKAPQAGKTTFPEECICFPENEQPRLWWMAEAETAAAVPCPLHGRRFDRIEVHGRPPYEALWLRQQTFELGWPHMSEQYRKAMRASFSPDRWPQIEESGKWNGPTTLILRDGTELPAGGRAEEWRACEYDSQKIDGLGRTQGLLLRSKNPERTNPMTLNTRRAMVRQHLEAAVRLQRESWDEALAIEDVIGDHDRDIYTFVAELAGGFKDDEAIPEDVIDTLMSRHLTLSDPLNLR